MHLSPFSCTAHASSEGLICSINSQSVNLNDLLQSELDSFLIQISAEILAFKDPNGEGFLVDKILDKTGMKGTGDIPFYLHPFDGL